MDLYEHLLVVGDEMSPDTGPADADGRRMLAEQERGASPLPVLVDEAALELLDLLEVDQSQHIHFE